jgi:hypothetical protein
MLAPVNNLRQHGLVVHPRTGRYMARFVAMWWVSLEQFVRW